MLKYKKLTKNNLKLATKIQLQIFPNESAYQEFIDCLNSNNEYDIYYLVYDNETIIGITGLYTITNVYETNTLWMGWYGVLSKHRNKGYGTKIILDTIKLAKRYQEKYNIKYLRVFTSTIENPDVIPLYDKLFDFKEIYNNIDDDTFNNSCVIYTKVLGNFEYLKWNNKFLNIKEMIEKEKVGNELFNQ